MSILTPMNVNDIDLSLTNDTINTDGLELVGKEVRVIDGRLIETRIFRNPRLDQSRTILVGPGDRIITYRGTGYYPGYLNNINSPGSYYIDGIEDSYKAQKDITKYFLYRILDVWLYRDLGYLLKFMVVDGNEVRLVNSLEEYVNNDVKKDTSDVIEKKADFLEENYLTMSDMKRMLKEIINIEMIKWHNLPAHERHVVKLVGKKLRRKLKKVLDL